MEDSTPIEKEETNNDVAKKEEDVKNEEIDNKDEKPGSGEVNEETTEDKNLTAKTLEEEAGEKPKTEDVTKEENEVVTIDDNGPKFPSDKEYFDALPPEEIEMYKEKGPGPDAMMEQVFQCTACFKQITFDHGNTMFRHPYLGVAICRNCKYMQEDDEGWTKDEDGFDEYCRWCGQGGDMNLCEFCKSAFCKQCIHRNCGRRKISEIKAADDWKCFKCEPEQICAQRAFYYNWFVSQELIKERKTKEKKEKTKKKMSKVQQKKAEERKLKEKLKEESLIHAPENFVDENLGEAFQTLEIYRKCLEDERRKWIRGKKKMDPQFVGTIAKSLRKIYAITKQNMDLLDTALVQSYSATFPEESGKRLEVAKLSLSPAKTPPKKKTPQAKKSSKKQKATDSDLVVLNGSPVIASDDEDDMIDPSQLLQVEVHEAPFRPSLVQKKKPSSPMTKSPMTKPGEYKVSLNLFKKKDSAKKGSPKKRQRSDSDEIEMIDLDDEEAKKDSENSPAKKKVKIGPKSKVKK